MKVYKMDRIDSSSLIELNRRLAEMLRQCQALLAGERAENAALRESNTRHEIINQELGQKVQTQAEQIARQAEENWHVNMEKVSFKRVNPAEKKILSAIYDLQKDIPSTIDGYHKITNKQLMDMTGFGLTAVKKHYASVEAKSLVFTRLGSGAGTQRYVKMDPQIARTPFAIHKIVLVDHVETRGGAREEKPTCFNCNSTRVRGHRHDMLMCDDCGQSWDNRSDIGQIEQAIDEADTDEMPTVRLPIVKPRFNLPVTPLPATVSPAGPDELCANCHRPRRLCWYPSRVVSGQWSASCQDHLVSAVR